MPKPRRYAEGTAVPVERSKADIEALVTRHGATGFMSAWGDRGGNRVAFVQFQLHSRMLRYDVPTPDVEDYRHDKGGRKRNAGAQQAAADAEHRRRWRALHLIIKAKLEIVASGDSSFDREFLADIMLPDGGTVGGHMLPQVAEAYASGKMPKLLPGKR